MKRPDRLFVKFMLSYLIILFIPMAAFFTIYRVNFLNYLKEAGEERLENALSRTATALNTELNRIHNIAYLIQTSADFINFKLNDTLTSIRAQEALRRFWFSNPTFRSKKQ